MYHTDIGTLKTYFIFSCQSISDILYVFVCFYPNLTVHSGDCHVYVLLKQKFGPKKILNYYEHTF